MVIYWILSKIKLWHWISKLILNLEINFSFQNFLKFLREFIFLKIIFEFENYFSKNILESFEINLKWFEDWW